MTHNSLITIRLPREYKRWLAETAKAEQVSMSMLLRRAVRLLLEMQEGDDD